MRTRTESKKCSKKKGIKQVWLIEQFGRNYNTVNSYMQNRQQPRLKVLYEVVKIYEVSDIGLVVE